MHVFLQGRASTLAFDEWVNVLNRRLRPAMNSHTVTKDGADVKETIKSVAKTLEDQKLFDLLTADGDAAAKRNVYLAALVYSYLESAPKLLNKRVQTALTAIKTKYKFIDFNTFSKAPPAQDGGKKKP